MRKVAANVLVVVGVLMLAAAGFLVNTSLGYAVTGLLCVLVGVGLVRTWNDPNGRNDQ